MQPSAPEQLGSSRYCAQSSGSPVVPLSLLSAIVSLPDSVPPLLLLSELAAVVSVVLTDELSVPGSVVLVVGDDVVGAPLVLLLELSVAAPSSEPSSGHAVSVVTASVIGMINLLRSNFLMPAS